jgi:hypothetical protein
MLTILKNNISPQLQDNYNYLVDRRCPLLGPVHAFGKGRIRRRPSAAQGRRLLRTFPFGPFVPGRNGEGSKCNLDRNKTATDRGRGGGVYFLCLFYFLLRLPRKFRGRGGDCFLALLWVRGWGEKWIVNKRCFGYKLKENLSLTELSKPLKA